MATRIDVLCGIGVLFAGFAVGAPKPAETAPVYFPSKVGDTRVYRLSNAEITETITSSDKKDEVMSLEMETTFPVGSKLKTLVRITDKGMFKTAEGETTYDPPICILPSPATPSKTWEFEYQVNDTKRTGKARIVGLEEVEVPAGKFKCIRVDSDYPGADGTTICISSWYAANVGLVKEAHGKNEMSCLKSFEAGPSTKVRK